jgi:hypothetical protein
MTLIHQLRFRVLVGKALKTREEKVMNSPFPERELRIRYGRVAHGSVYITPNYGQVIQKFLCGGSFTGRSP